MGAEARHPNTDSMTRLALLWAKAQPAVTAFVMSIVRNPHDADDVIQATVSYIAQHLDDYDPERPFVAWAIGIARYRIMEHRNQLARQPLLLGDEAMASVCTAMTEQADQIDARREALQHCIQRLNQNHQQVLTSRYYDQNCTQDIADQLGVKSNTVYVMLRRIRLALRDCINGRLRGATS